MMEARGQNIIQFPEQTYQWILERLKNKLPYYSKMWEVKAQTSVKKTPTHSTKREMTQSNKISSWNKRTSSLMLARGPI